MATVGEIHACIALGSNLGDRAANIQQAVDRLGRVDGVRVVDSSAPINTEARAVAAGVDPGGDYLNAAAVIATTLAPVDLLIELKRIERAIGRDAVQQSHGRARVIDLDILLFGDQVINQPGLTIPHPRMCERTFVLMPLVTVAGDWRIPNAGVTVRQALAGLQDRDVSQASRQEHRA